MFAALVMIARLLRAAFVALRAAAAIAVLAHGSYRWARNQRK